MPRQLRIEYPGAIYHVKSRGDRREEIFVDEADSRTDLAARERRERTEKAKSLLARSWEATLVARRCIWMKNLTEDKDEDDNAAAAG